MPVLLSIPTPPRTHGHFYVYTDPHPLPPRRSPGIQQPCTVIPEARVLEPGPFLTTPGETWLTEKKDAGCPPPGHPPIESSWWKEWKTKLLVCSQPPAGLDTPSPLVPLPFASRTPLS